MEGPKLFELKINDNLYKYPAPVPIQPDPDKVMASQGIYPANYVPIANPFAPTIHNALIPWQYAPNNVPIIKKYNIQLSNANGDYTKIAQIYEDVLPTVNGIIQKNLTSINERLIIHNFLRSIFIRKFDGEEISINGNNKNSIRAKHELNNLLSHIKLMDINPYHFSRIQNNAYKTLPKDFVMFRSCYPVRHERMYNNIQCAENNIGINIRVYRMLVMDMNANKIGSRLKKIHCDLWREIFYYEYIREEIIKKKICPNFVLMYSYYTSENTGIDFDKLYRLKEDLGLENNQSDIMNRKLYEEKFKKDLETTLKRRTKYIPNPILKERYINQVYNNWIMKKIDPQFNRRYMFRPLTEVQLRKYQNQIKELDNKDIDLVDITLPTNKCLVSLTEAPTHNIIDFATKTYQIDSGPIRKMVKTGFHDDRTWASIVFQIVYALFIMLHKNITINKMRIGTNIFIKDLNIDETNIGYWRYKYDNIDFYIPNYGYIVLIDTTYSDIKGGLNTVVLQYPQLLNYEFKIIGEIFDNDPEQIKKCRDLHFDNMIQIINRDNFSNDFTHWGGVKPPRNILDKLNDINDELNKLKIIADEQVTSTNTQNMIDNKIITHVTTILLNAFKEFLHNKIGYFVKEGEKELLNTGDDNFKNGSIIAHKILGSEDSYTWALYIKKITESFGKDEEIIDTHSILTIHHDDIDTSKTPKLIIKPVRSGEIIKIITTPDQTFKPNQKLTDDDIIETYSFYTA